MVAYHVENQLAGSCDLRKALAVIPPCCVTGCARAVPQSSSLNAHAYAPNLKMIQIFWGFRWTQQHKLCPVSAAMKSCEFQLLFTHRPVLIRTVCPGCACLGSTDDASLSGLDCITAGLQICPPGQRIGEPERIMMMTRVKKWATQ